MRPTGEAEKSITYAFVRDMLSYDPETGVFVWIKKPARCINVGSVAGNAGPRYRRIRLLGTPVAASRIAWMYMTGSWPEHEIDHENLDGLDNRWSNLRPAKPSQNKANRRRLRSNKSGYVGVFKVKHRDLWVAKIRIKGKQTTLGFFREAADAGAAYAAAAVVHHGEFARAETRLERAKMVA